MTPEQITKETELYEAFMAKTGSYNPDGLRIWLARAGMGGTDPRPKITLFKHEVEDALEWMVKARDYLDKIEVEGPESESEAVQIREGLQAVIENMEPELEGKQP